MNNYGRRYYSRRYPRSKRRAIGNYGAALRQIDSTKCQFKYNT